MDVEPGQERSVSAPDAAEAALEWEDASTPAYKPAAAPMTAAELASPPKPSASAPDSEPAASTHAAAARQQNSKQARTTAATISDAGPIDSLFAAVSGGQEPQQQPTDEGLTAATKGEAEQRTPKRRRLVRLADAPSARAQPAAKAPVTASDSAAMPPPQPWQPSEPESTAQTPMKPSAPASMPADAPQTEGSHGTPELAAALAALRQPSGQPAEPGAQKPGNDGDSMPNSRPTPEWAKPAVEIGGQPIASGVFADEEEDEGRIPPLALVRCLCFHVLLHHVALSNRRTEHCPSIGTLQSGLHSTHCLMVISLLIDCRLGSIISRRETSFLHVPADTEAAAAELAAVDAVSVHQQAAGKTGAAAGSSMAEQVQAAAAGAAAGDFDVNAELSRLGVEEKQLRQSARRKVTHRNPVRPYMPNR